MSASLLQKEEQYRKVNEELQNRNKKLMEEFDNVMKTQNTLLKETLQSDTICDYSNSMHRKSDGDTILNKSKDDSTIFTKQYESGSTKENSQNLQNIIPDSVDQMGIKGMTHFYRGKIKQLLCEKDRMQLEYKLKCEELKNIEKDKLKLIEEKEKWAHAFNSNKINNAKLESQILLSNSKSQTKESENVALRREIEQYKKEIKSHAINGSATELRLTRALEENEKMRTALKRAKQEERDMIDTYKKEIADISTMAKRSEKQKSELLNAFKKQMQLIDTMKKQKTFLEALKLSQLSENEFMKVLDIKVDT